MPAGVKRTQVSYDDEATLVAALQGQQFLIITLSFAAPPDTHSKLVRAASQAGVPYIMPNVYGSDIQNESLREQDLYGAAALKRCLEIESQANTAYVAMVCGFWYEWSLALGERFFGFDISNRNVTFFDNGTTPITTSTWGQCGRAVAALLSLPEDDNGTGEPAVSRWKNKPLYIGSFSVSQRDILDSIHRVTGTTDADWTISHQPSAQRYKEALDELKKGDRTAYGKAMYTRVFFPNGGGDFESVRGLDNGAIGLAKDELDEATRRAVDLVRRGWNPFAGRE